MILSTLLQSNEWLSAQRYDFEDGFTMAYTNQLKFDRPNLHFLHGNGFAVRSYQRFLASFAEDYNLILQEAAGHGGSSTGERFVGWNETAERFSISLKAHEVALPKTENIGVGHSFGGCMTTLMSAQDPTVFDRLILLDPALSPPRLLWLLRGASLFGLKGKIPLAKQAKRRRTQWETMDQVKASFTGRGIFKGWDPLCLDDYIQHSIRQDESSGLYQLSCPVWMESDIFASYPRGLWKAIRSISVPTYIIQGKHSFPYFKEAYRLAERLNSNITVIEVEGGHCFMQEHPEKTAQLIKGLLGKESK
ncbi:alpha/beta hydrolase [Marinomonas sp. TI.3.20]|uniref:alpha/beta fold hydrolase n=1 Tax=Marinomonas sp. TI.3.20 TaxID=3121296 RepID=UPI00311EEE5F